MRGDDVSRQRGPAGAAGQQIARDVALFNPAEQVFQAMLDGWRNQQLSRNLAFTTIARREQVVQRFRSFTGEDPWSWTVGDVDEFFMELRAVRSASHSTLLTYQNALRLFLGYLTDPAYGWEQECMERFGTHPVQVCHEWNTAAHVQEASARPRKRPLTRDELQDLFDYADDRPALRRSKRR
jgi:integrase/recombinase XerC